MLNAIIGIFDLVIAGYWVARVVDGGNPYLLILAITFFGLSNVFMKMALSGD